MAGKTDLRWSDTEWAALAGYADARGLTPGRAVKALVLERLRVGPPAAEKGRARGVPAGAAVGLLNEFAAAPRRDVGGALPAREVPCEGGCGASIGWDGLCAVCEAEFAAGRDDRPGGSAGSGVPVPPAGVAAPVVAPPPTAGAPDLVPVLEAVAGALRARGMAESQARLLARKSILAGSVVIDGEVCRDPQALVDPGSMSS